MKENSEIEMKRKNPILKKYQSLSELEEEELECFL